MLPWPARNHESCSPGKEQVSGTGRRAQGRVGAPLKYSLGPRALQAPGSPGSLNDILGLLLGGGLWV